MLTWNDFKCESPHISRHRIDNCGDYSEMWCGRLEKYIENCDNCPFNEKEKIMRSDPNSYQKWLKLHNKNN